MHAELFLHCPECAEIRAAETPPCPDGHGDDCPDRACAMCGTGLFIDPQTAGTGYRPAARHAA
jgi:hypothetical protein